MDLSFLSNFFLAPTPSTVPQKMSASMESAAAKATSVLNAAHPYFPVEAVIANYVPNTHSVPVLLGIFAAGTGAILGGAYLGLSRFAPWVKKGDKMAILWFILCGFIHSFFEGYFMLNHTRMGPANNIFGQLWKEYAYSDSRYLFSDPFVLCMESITAVCWGPLSFLVAYFITIQHPLRHPIQAIVSLGQIYGDVLYYATSMFDLYYKEISYCRPEAYYFWAYFFMMNWFWIVIPGYLLYQSTTTTARAFKALDKMGKTLETNGKPYANGSAKANGHAKKSQ